MTGLPATRPQTAEAVNAWLKALSEAHTPVADVIDLLEQLAPQPDDPIYTRVHQQRAFWLSKFSDLPAEMRHERALQIMRDQLDLAKTVDRETLGIAGGICKRMWQDDGRRLHLDRALVYYTRGHNNPEPGNNYYTSINAAYLEAMIAEQELLAGFDAAAVAPRYARASVIYDTIVAATLAKSYVPDDWWTYATVAEAYLGLGRSGDAATWLARGIDRFAPTDKDRNTTLPQLAHLIQLQSASRGKAWREAAESDIATAFDIDLRAARGAVIGKVGLALSGGGFRASLYHIGVFARLAELDLLRHVEVLSCVSGGSIIGAQYYLELRHRLEEKSVLTRADYIEIVHALETKFLEGVQTNIRTSVATDLRLNLRMLFDADYSRTERVAELYDEELFARTPATLPLYLNELKIVPPGFTTFNPREQNWSRASKVPILILNATSLNTGHQWQFTAVGMGEPPYTAAQIDAVEIHPHRAYGTDGIRLSRAVAASSGVPGLFSPLVVRRDGRAISLVDGGVHDNQGVASLLEQECKTIIVSDASGQLKATEATNGVVAPPLRSNSILQARLRESQIKDLLARRRAGLLQGFTFVHMTMQLENAATAPSTATRYGVRHDVQKLLAEMRTDLDSFNDAEAYALMMSGYRMITCALETSLTAPGFTAMASGNPPHHWDFLRVAGAIDGSDPGPSQALYEILSNTGNAKRRKRALLVATFAVIALVLLAVTLLVPLGLVLLGLFVLFLFVRYRDPDHPKPFDEFVVGILLATAGWVAANVYLDQYEPAERNRGAWPKR